MRDKLILVCLVAAMGLLVVVSPASAAAPKLVFTSGGTPYSGLVGTTVNFTAGDSEAPSCSAFYFESQLTNGRPKDPVALTGFSRTECAGPEYTLSADFRTITFIWNGQVIIHGKATLAGPGPCVYSLTNLIAALEIPGISLTGNSPVKAALVRSRSNLFCAPLETLNLEVNFDVSGEFLADELRGG
jgi:hypothetical protein